MSTVHVTDPVGQEAPPPQISRRAEVWCAAVGMVAATALLGGFTLVMNGLDEQTFATSGMPELLGLGELNDAQAYNLASTLAAWFGFTLVAVLLLAAVGVLVARGRPWRRTAGWWFLAAGLVCLFGSQMILYPVAFIFFVCAGLFALRRIEHRSVS